MVVEALGHFEQHTGRGGLCAVAAMGRRAGKGQEAGQIGRGRKVV